MRADGAKKKYIGRIKAEQMSTLRVLKTNLNPTGISIVKLTVYSLTIWLTTYWLLMIDQLSFNSLQKKVTLYGRQDSPTDNSVFLVTEISSTYNPSQKDEGLIKKHPQIYRPGLSIFEISRNVICDVFPPQIVFTKM